MARRKGSSEAGPPGDNPSKPTEGKTVGQGGTGQGKPDQFFDAWLDRGLHKMFDSVAQEPIPEELLRLIEEDRNK